MNIEYVRGGRARLASAAFSLLLLVVCAPAALRAQTRTEYRAFWVDTFNTALDNHAQVLDVISRAKLAKANAVFVQVRRRGDSWYLDSLEPRADRRPAMAPDFDPLLDLITEAHKPENNLEVHAFVIVGALWNRDPRCANLQPPAGHAFLSHGGFDPTPSVMNVDPNRDDNWLTRTLLPDTNAHQLTCQTTTPPNISFNGQRFGAEFWIDLGHPEAAKYTHDVLMHLVRKYEIDGLHLDRIRYPEFAASGQTAANGTNVGYNKTSVRRFNEHYGSTGNPLPSDAQWKQWRRDQVTNFVRRLYLGVMAEKPQVKVSASLIAFGGIANTNDATWNNAEAYWRVYQDWRAWTEEGILDIAMPMAYKREHNAGEAAQYDQWNAWLRTHLYNRAGILGQGGLSNAIEGTLRQTRRTLTPDTNLSGISFYSMATSNVATTNPTINPYALPTPTPTLARSFAEFASGLTTGKSVNGATLYEPAGQTPIFAEAANIPTFSWKLAPTKGHARGEAFDADNRPLDTATVQIENLGTQATRSTKTDGNGFFGSVDLDPGSYRATVGSSYFCFNVMPGVVADAVRDTLAPVTVAAPQPATPDGQNGWYVSNVSLTLNASDNCAGVSSTEYSTDGGQTWQPYAGAFSLTDDGTHVVLYRSADAAGNAETAQSLVVKIDKTAPTLSLSATPDVIWPANNQPFEVSVGGSGADATSGLAAVTYVVTDEYGAPLSIDPRALSGNSAGWAESLTVEASRRGDDRDGRLYRVTATLTDQAGNTSTAAADIVVPHDRRQH
ncbi:MAG TPA: family 10 glycosylhydrolase [Pyrinomonadaceae bacterium]|nr:family 10 glycosylhydrolase [Pyrinomonadaceae bacterium]